jgi:hypothetical protein
MVPFVVPPRRIADPPHIGPRQPARDFGHTCRMADVPTTQYARSSDGAFVAYQVVGEGPVDIVFIRSAFNHLEMQWEHPGIVEFFTGLSSIGRLVMFDARGVGMSDPLVGGSVPALEDWADDALTVMDALQIGSAALSGLARPIPEPSRSLRHTQNEWMRSSSSTAVLARSPPRTTPSASSPESCSR